MSDETTSDLYLSGFSHAGAWLPDVEEPDRNMREGSADSLFVTDDEREDVEVEDVGDADSVSCLLGQSSVHR